MDKKLLKDFLDVFDTDAGERILDNLDDVFETHVEYDESDVNDGCVQRHMGHIDVVLYLRRILNKAYAEGTV